MKKSRVFFNKEFYNKKVIEKAIIDFKEVCSAKIIDDKISVELTQKQETEELLKEEFENYVLGLMKENSF